MPTATLHTTRSRRSRPSAGAVVGGWALLALAGCGSAGDGLDSGFTQAVAVEPRLAADRPDLLQTGPQPTVPLPPGAVDRARWLCGADGVFRAVESPAPADGDAEEAGAPRLMGTVGAPGELRFEVRLAGTGRGRLEVIPQQAFVPSEGDPLTLGFAGANAAPVEADAAWREGALPETSPWWPGYWNRFRITLESYRTRVWLNGVSVLDLEGRSIRGMADFFFVDEGVLGGMRLRHIRWRDR